jgi:5-methyltetrahydropteroyltriglutamate--homocysteine methyltransferase
VAGNENGGSSAKNAEFMGAMLTGIFSRSSATSKVHRANRDGYASESELRAAFDKDSAEIINRQNGFAFISSGQVDWLDILRPLSSCFNGFEKRVSSGEDAVGPVTRWFRTNTFYRKPLVNGKIECNGDELAKAAPDAGKNAVLVLTAPYSFSKLVENNFYKNGEELARDYARALAKSMPKLYEKGYRCVLLVDPFVGYEISKGNFSRPSWYAGVLSEAKNPQMKLGVLFPLVEAKDAVPLAEDSSVDFIGIDAVFSNSLKITTKKDILLGLVDGSRVGVESAEKMKKTVDEFVKRSEFSGRYYIGPNDRLYDVPFEIALQKLDALASFKG